MSRRDTATNLLVSKVVRDGLAKADKAYREQARADFDVPGVRDIGVIGSGDNAQQIGSVQLVKGRESWTVTDPDALLAWVKANRPEEVVTVEQVRPSYIGALLMQAKKDGAPVTSDGELVPGIEQRTGEPSLNVKPSEDAAQTIAQALADGRLTLADIAAPLPIEGGE